MLWFIHFGQPLLLECTTIERTSAVAPAICIAPQKFTSFVEAPRCPMALRSKIASEWRLSLPISVGENDSHWGNSLRYLVYNDCQSLAKGDVRVWCARASTDVSIIFGDASCDGKSAIAWHCQIHWQKVQVQLQKDRWGCLPSLFMWHDMPLTQKYYLRKKF